MPRVMDKAYMRDNSNNIHTGQALWLALTMHVIKQPRKKRNVRSNKKRLQSS